ncbi:hypothetical protein FKW77_003578 [Venturia effusa]|uniref:Uncharacterized protein n=1 Tax=Venturia effusa TaxID=50376 RepID=A0A517LPV4_9PEZI|nr:hypothetical protein FKW77_003578 [Venturia effusa]
MSTNVEEDRDLLESIFGGENNNVEGLLAAIKESPTDVGHTDNLWRTLLAKYFPDTKYHVRRRKTRLANGDTTVSLNLFVLEHGVTSLKLTIHLRSPNASEDPIIEHCTKVAQRGWMKGYTACIKALGVEFECFRCIRPENDGDECGRENSKILTDQVEEDADVQLDGVVLSLTDEEDQKTFDKIMLSLREQTVQNGGGHASEVPTYDIDDPFE